MTTALQDTLLAACPNYDLGDEPFASIFNKLADAKDATASIAAIDTIIASAAAIKQALASAHGLKPAAANGPPTYFVAVHHHNQGTSEYLYRSTNGLTLSEEEVVAMLGDVYEPDRDEWIELTTFNERDIIKVAGPPLPSASLRLARELKDKNGN